MLWIVLLLMILGIVFFKFGAISTTVVFMSYMLKGIVLAIVVFALLYALNSVRNKYL